MSARGLAPACRFRFQAEATVSWRSLRHTCRMAGSDVRLLDHALLDGFADALRRSAAPVAASMGPGLSEDEIRTVCAQASLAPSDDAITWFTYWDALAEPPTKFVEVLPA